MKQQKTEVDLHDFAIISQEKRKSLIDAGIIDQDDQDRKSLRNQRSTIGSQNLFQKGTQYIQTSTTMIRSISFIKWVIGAIGTITVTLLGKYLATLFGLI